MYIQNNVKYILVNSVNIVLHIFIFTSIIKVLYIFLHWLVWLFAVPKFVLINVFSNNVLLQIVKVCKTTFFFYLEKSYRIYNMCAIFLCFQDFFLVIELTCHIIQSGLFQIRYTGSMGRSFLLIIYVLLVKTSLQLFFFLNNFSNKRNTPPSPIVLLE